MPAETIFYIRSNLDHGWTFFYRRMSYYLESGPSFHKNLSARRASKRADRLIK
jgi:hypothetical protein